MISIFDAIAEYFKDLFLATRSVWRSARASLPYLVGWGEKRKEVTEQYPDPVSSRTHEDLPPRTRGFLWNDIEKCTGCGDCQARCPVSCIKIQAEPGPDSQKLWVARFEIDFGLCLFCGFCVEDCVPQSLVHTAQFEGATARVQDLIGQFGRGAISRELREKWAYQREKMERL